MILKNAEYDLDISDLLLDLQRLEKSYQEAKNNYRSLGEALKERRSEINQLLERN
tara:strand:+ start:196 stop:360 length:165 start_codon:yes stop_codon:yes gene_type:complete